MGRLVKTIENFTLNRFHPESLIDCLRTYVHSIQQIFATKDAEHLLWLLLIVLTISVCRSQQFNFFYHFYISVPACLHLGILVIHSSKVPFKVQHG